MGDDVQKFVGRNLARHSVELQHEIRQISKSTHQLEARTSRKEETVSAQTPVTMAQKRDEVDTGEKKNAYAKIKIHVKALEMHQVGRHDVFPLVQVFQELFCNVYAPAALSWHCVWLWGE